MVTLNFLIFYYKRSIYIKITEKILYFKLFVLLLLSDVGHIDFMLGLFCG